MTTFSTTPLIENHSQQVLIQGKPLLSVDQRADRFWTMTRIARIGGGFLLVVAGVFLERYIIQGLTAGAVK